MEDEPSPPGGSPDHPEKSRGESSRTMIPWKQPGVKKDFLALVYREKAHLKTGTSLADKFEAIASELTRNHASFKNYGKVKGPALEKQFRRYREGLLRQLHPDEETGQVLPTESFSEEDKLLYEMILEMEETHGKVAKHVKKSRRRSATPDKASTKRRRQSSTLNSREVLPQRERSQVTEDSRPRLESPTPAVQVAAVPNNDLQGGLERLFANNLGDVFEAIARDIRNSEEAQRHQTDTLQSLVNIANDMNSAIGALNLSVTKLVDLMTALVSLQAANNSAR